MRVVRLQDLPPDISIGLKQALEQEPTNQRVTSLPLNVVLRYYAKHFGGGGRIPVTPDELLEFAGHVKTIVESSHVEPFFDEPSLVRVMRVHGTAFHRAVAEAWLVADEAQKRDLRRQFNGMLEIYRPFAVAERSKPR